ncbi:hypothetical protein VM98_07765 [Streptomyces rubellomurinus subsp. indigoferus]|nr:hypothetical protein VM98_07765 [Streptomyces rubellomurinus subsp. indigoferus]
MKLHRYLEGVSLTAFGAGNRRIIRAVRPHAKKARLTRQQVGGGLALLAFFSPVLAHPVARYAPTTITVVLVLWVVVAVVVGNTSPDAESEADDQALADASGEAGPDDAEDQDDELQDAPADADLYALVRYVAGMSDQGTAAHLSHVLEEGQARDLFGGWKVPDLRAHLEGLGVALVEGKKLTFNGRQRNRLAVLLNALPDTAPGTVPAVVRKAA